MAEIMSVIGRHNRGHAGSLEMSGSMEKSARNRAWKSLRKEAKSVQQEVESERLVDEKLAPSYPSLRAAWRAFPECNDDWILPPVADILSAADMADAIDLFEKRNSCTKKNRWLENQTDFLGE